MEHQQGPQQNVYFKPLLPWQQTVWEGLISRYDRLPHGLLFSGMQGLGKRDFVWRFVAWLLCDNRLQALDAKDQQGGCGHCQSCQWLASGTHPDLKVLPASSLPNPNEDNITLSTKKAKTTKKSLLKNQVKLEPDKSSIKVDDIRELQPFISQGSSGRRVCVIDNADMMTIAAANALLKTLEEPREGIHLLLITDWPTKLLPTIKSRVQQVAIDQIQRDKVVEYLKDYIHHNKIIEEDEEQLSLQINQALKLANGAPLAALEMISSDWYQFRDTWIKVWLALRVGKRSSIAASDYWQKQLSIDAFIKLSEFMLMDFSRQSLGIKPLQVDIDWDGYVSIKSLSIDAIQQVMNLIEDIKVARNQNLQDKMAYDRVLTGLAAL